MHRLTTPALRPNEHDRSLGTPEETVRGPVRSAGQAFEAYWVYHRQLGTFASEGDGRNSRLGIIPLRLPLVLEVTVDPVLAILALLAFAPLLVFLSLFSPVAHCNYLFS